MDNLRNFLRRVFCLHHYYHRDYFGGNLFETRECSKCGKTSYRKSELQRQRIKK